MTLPKRHFAPLLAMALYMVPLRRAEGEEDRVDFKMMYYQESDDRIQVVSPTVLYETELSPTLTLKIDGIYNAISGASPTGAPPIPRTVLRTQRAVVDSSKFAARAGATGTSSSPTPSSGGGGGGGSGASVRTSPIGVVSSSTDFVVPTAEVDETRIGANVELIKRLDGHTVSGQLSFSTESDYDSYGGAIKDSIDFNDKSTTLTLGLAFIHDLIEGTAIDGEESKDTFDFLLGVTQVVTPKTLVSANLTLGYSTGYLGDPYKVAEIDGVLYPEVRPDNKTRQVLYLSLLHYFDGLNASIEPNYRFYNDSFGISGNTVGLAWHQKLGDQWIVTPYIRYYDQSEADFYGVRFTGSPDEYSADYRVSALTAMSYGLKLVWKPSDRVSFDLAYEYYKQEGKEDTLPEDVYPEASLVSGGMRVWF